MRRRSRLILTLCTTFLGVGAGIFKSAFGAERGLAAPAAADEDFGATRRDRTTKPRTKKRPVAAVAPWYLPKVSLGAGLSVPELLPIETHLTFGRYFALRFFYVPPLPFNIRVEMPSDVITAKSKQGIGVANPDFIIRMHARYGPQYGAEALVFPFGGSFFMAFGASSRTMAIHGATQSPLLICTLAEAAKEPPCPDPSARIQTETELELTADLKTEALLMRGALGFYWHAGDFGYVTLAAGATRPTRIRRDARVNAGIDSPGDDDELSGVLAEVKEEKEAELEAKAVKAMRPVDEKVLPIAALSAGIRF